MRHLKMLILCASLVHSVAFAKHQPLDGVAAIVNDSIITQSDLVQQTKLIEQQIIQSGNSLPDAQSLEKQVLEHLILNEIQMQLAKRTGIQIDDQTLDTEIENMAKRNQMSVTQLRETMALEGISFNVYRNNLRQQMMISQLQQRDIMPDLQVSEQEITQFLQSPNGLGAMITEYHLGHILITLPEAPTPEELAKASTKAQQLIAQLRQGKDFAQTAIAESTGESALSGGDLGWRKLPELPTIFVKVVPTLKVNDIPDPIRSPSGLHIIKLLDKRSAQQAQTATEKTHVRHILIKTNALISDNDAQKRLLEIREQILKGEDFAKLAKAHSNDMASASNGGSLGWISKDVLVADFANVMENLRVQEISEPFKTSFGWHIMQVLDRKTQNSDETGLRQKAKQMIQQRKYEEKLQAWSRQLRDEAYVKINAKT